MDSLYLTPLHGLEDLALPGPHLPAAAVLPGTAGGRGGDAAEQLPGRKGTAGSEPGTTPSGPVTGDPHLPAVPESGPVADAVSRVTAAVQEAIDSCGRAGGGLVDLDVPGTWVVDGLRLASHVELRLGEGVRLRGSGRTERYTQRPGPFELLSHETPICALIHGQSLVGARLSGPGTLDGAWEHFIRPGQGEEVAHLAFFTYPRPMTVYLEDCEETVIDGLHVTGAPFWTVHLVGCRDTVVRGVEIRNEMRMPNTDGIDVDRCQDTLIEGCVIRTGDDAICPKCTEETARYGRCTGLVVRDCVLESQSSAIKLGSSSFEGFEDLVFERVRIERSNRGLTLQLRDPGVTRDVVFRDVEISTSRFSPQWWGSGEPVHVSLVPREVGTDLGMSEVSGVRFERVSWRSQTPALVCAWEGRASGIEFIGCRAERVGVPADGAGSGEELDLRPSSVVRALQVEEEVWPVVTTLSGVSWDGRPVPVTEEWVYVRQP